MQMIATTTPPHTPWIWMIPGVARRIALLLLFSIGKRNLPFSIRFRNQAAEAVGFTVNITVKPKNVEAKYKPRLAAIAELTSWFIARILRKQARHCSRT